MTVVFVMGFSPNFITGFRHHRFTPDAEEINCSDHKSTHSSIHLLEEVWYCTTMNCVVLCFSWYVVSLQCIGSQCGL